jgi:transaldolase
MNGLDKLKIKIFADGADKAGILKFYKEKYIKGFTTNPTLMKKDGVTNYEAFAKDILSEITDLPLSFEVFSDDFSSMEREARIIGSWAKNVYVKIPITNTKGESSANLIKKLSDEGISLNITAMLTIKQVEEVEKALNPKAKAFISVFAGRAADTGVNPIPLMKKAAEILKYNPDHELLWASCRELLNIFHAEECGCKIITVTHDILKKISMIGKDLTELSLDTVRMFYNDAQNAGYKL